MINKRYEYSLKILKKYWGYTDFREFQKPLINSILQMNDSLGIIPTGGGKSLCFQVPGIMLKGLTIVISPLIALMKDQVKTLQDKGIEGEFINSQLDPSEKKVIIRKMLSGNLKFLYVSPERFCNEQFIDLLNNVPISMVTIDEAHMLVETIGFRDQFTSIGDYIKLLKNKQQESFPERQGKIIISAFTATITRDGEEFIKNSLQMNDPYVLRIENERKNLFIGIHKFSSDKEKVNAILKTVISLDKIEGSKIIFCMTRKDTKKISEMLKLYGYESDYFHGDMTVARKNSVFNKFIKNKIEWVCATNAFGMGIDKSDIRTVLHYGIPFNIGQYAQEIGRAGRDGENSICIMFYSNKDIQLRKFMIQQGDKSVKNEKLSDLQQIEEFATLNSNKEYNEYIKNYFN